MKSAAACDADSLQELVDAETDDLSALFQDQTDAKYLLDEELTEILEIALELKGIFMQSMAIFSLSWPSVPHDSTETVTYDEEQMDPERVRTELSEHSSVEFFISPGLVKRGNAGGRNYDKCNVLVKASVVCD